MLSGSDNMSAVITHLADAGIPVLLASFSLRGSLYALNAITVQEVIRPRKLTRVPHAPAAVLGVINLRGRIVTVFDTAILLDLGARAQTAESRIFVLEDDGEFFGLLVDSVSDVTVREASGCGAVPATVPAHQMKFYEGTYRHKGQVIALLNARSLLAAAGSAGEVR